MPRVCATPPKRLPPSGVVAILSFIVAAVTTFLLYTEWDKLSQYIGDGLGA